MKTIMKKITLLFSLFVFSFLSAQQLEPSGIISNGGENMYESKTVTDWLFHGDGVNASSIGTNSGDPFTIGCVIYLDPSILVLHSGRQIEEVKFYCHDASILDATYTIDIYTSTTGAPDYTETLNSSDVITGWNTVVLATPYPITGTQGLYVGYEFFTTTFGQLNGIDAGPNVAGGNFYSFNGGAWTDVAGVTDANFSIQAGVGGATGNNDVGMLSISMDDKIVDGNVNIEGTLVNLGVNNLTSVEVNWQVDSGTVYTETVTGLDLATGETHNFIHSDIWAATVGAHVVTVWVSNMNGIGADELPANDSLDHSVFVINEIYPKVAIYEEGTGTWCGWCVRGLVGLKDMAHYYDDGSWIGIGVHNGDPMVNTEYDNALGISSFPSGKMNRKQATVDPGLSALETSYASVTSEIPTAKVDITAKSWDVGTREITVDVTSTFALDLASADFNAALIIVENGVTGTASGYNQTNYYASNGIDMIDWEGINWRFLGNPIPAADIIYNHVGRTLVGGWSGVAGSIPASVTYDTPYTYTFTHTLPAGQNEDEIELVAIIIDNQTGEIENATEMALDYNLAVDEFVNQIGFSVYPNPATDVLNIKSNKIVDLEIVNNIGQRVFYRNSVGNGAVLDLSKLNSGMYFITITDGVQSGMKKIIIE